MIGVFSDSHGDLDAFDAAYELLRRKGARRFFFVGGRYSDLDHWMQRKRERARGGRAYSDADFLADISNFLTSKEQVSRPAAFGNEDTTPEGEDLSRVADKFLRTPEKDSLEYRDPNVPKIAVDMLGNALCCVVYDKNDLTRDDVANATVFVHGNQSEPKVLQFGPRFFITPGKLTGAAEQTCGLLEVMEKNLRFSAFCLDGRTILDGQVLALGGKTKLSVK